MKKILLGIFCLSVLVLCSCERQNPQNENNIDILGTGIVSTQDPADDIIVCTADVYKCPDGSYVSRHGPDCEFEPCPTTDESIGNEIASQGDETVSSGIGGNDTKDTTLDTSGHLEGQDNPPLQEGATDIDEIIQKYENSEEFNENGVDMLYEIIQSLEQN